MDKRLLNEIEQLIKLEQESAKENSAQLQLLMNMGVRDIAQLDRVADRLLDTMHGLTAAGEDVYRQYLDYIATFNPTEAKERKENLEYDLGYKTHVLYAAAILCRKELNGCTAPDGRTSFQVIMDEYIPKVYNVQKKTASFLFFAHFANGRTVSELMPMLRTITEETDFVKENVDDLESLMHFPHETYHPLTEDEWHKIQFIAEHNIELYSQHLEINKDLMNRVFGR